MKYFGYSLLLSFSFALDACNGSTPPPVVGVLEWERVELAADAAEPIVSIAVKEGEQVAQGQIILQLDARRAQAQVDEARASHAQAQARLRELARGARAERILESSARLTGAEQIFAVRNQEFERAGQLLQQKLVSPDDVDKARAARDSARAERDALRAQLDELQSGTTKEELEQARQAVARADAGVRLAELSMERLTLRAPVAARVDSLPLHIGERPRAGSVVAVLLEGTHPYARVYVPEPERARVVAGSAAEIRVDGVGAALRGQVRVVSAEPAFTPYFALTEQDRSRLSYVAKVDFIGDVPPLPAGVPVNVYFAAPGADVKP